MLRSKRKKNSNAAGGGVKKLTRALGQIETLMVKYPRRCYGYGTFLNAIYNSSQYQVGTFKACMPFNSCI